MIPAPQQAPISALSPPTFLTSLAGQRLWSYLPAVDQTSPTLAALCQMLGSELDSLYQAMDQVPLQTDVTTATWGLTNLEADYGLPPLNPDDVADRQARLLALLRRPPRITLAQLRTICQSWVNGDVHVVQDAPASTIYVYFIDTSGVPADLTGLDAALNAAAPARLGIQYVFRYLLWSDSDAWDSNQGATWNEQDALTDPTAGAGGYMWTSWDEINPVSPPSGI